MTSEKCYFCKNPLSEGSRGRTDLEQTIYRKILNTSELETKTILIPRCESCCQFHAKSNKQLMGGIWLGVGASTLACLFIGATTRWLVGILSSVVICFLSIALAGLYFYLKRDKERENESHWITHPIYLELEEEGWALTEDAAKNSAVKDVEPSSFSKHALPKVQGVLILSEKKVAKARLDGLAQQILDSEKKKGYGFSEGCKVVYDNGVGSDVSSEMFASGRILKNFSSSSGGEILNRTKKFPWHFPDGASGQFYIIYEYREPK